jgi:two-component system chemotaxis response regulator CheB
MTVNETGEKRDVIVIGASAGGVQALLQLLGRLPSDLQAIIGIVLHRAPYYQTQLPFVLGRHCALRVREPSDGEPLEYGCVYVAPRDQHLLFKDGRAHLNRGPREHLTRPAVDPLFRSAAAEFGPRVVGVLLTGYGSDGTPGLIAIKAAGGLSLVQDPHEALHPTMPRRAIAGDDVDAVLPLNGIADALVALASGREIQSRSPLPT